MTIHTGLFELDFGWVRRQPTTSCVAIGLISFHQDFPPDFIRKGGLNFRPVKTRFFHFTACLVTASFALADVRADDKFDSLKHELDALKQRVTALEDENLRLKEKELEVERLIVR